MKVSVSCADAEVQLTVVLITKYSSTNRLIIMDLASLFALESSSSNGMA